MNFLRLLLVQMPSLLPKWSASEQPELLLAALKQGAYIRADCEACFLSSSVPKSRVAPWPPLSVLGTVSYPTLRRRYQVARLTPSAAHGRSASLLPSGDALRFRALPVCFAERAACRASHADLCPCCSHFRRYLSTDRAMPATSESGSGSRPYASATSRFSACAMVSAATPRSPRQVAMNRSRFRPIPVWAMRGLRQLNGMTDDNSSSEYGLRRPQTVSALGCAGLRDRPQRPDQRQAHDGNTRRRQTYRLPVPRVPLGAFRQGTASAQLTWPPRRVRTSQE